MKTELRNTEADHNLEGIKKMKPWQSSLSDSAAALAPACPAASARTEHQRHTRRWRDARSAGSLSLLLVTAGG